LWIVGLSHNNAVSDEQMSARKEEARSGGSWRAKEEANLLPLSRQCGQSPTRQVRWAIKAHVLSTAYSISHRANIASALNGGLRPPFVDQLVVPMFEQPFRFNLGDDAYMSFLGLFHFMEHDPPSTRFTGEHYGVWMNMKILIAPHASKCSIRHPPCPVAPVAAHKTLAQPFLVTFATLHWQTKPHHVLLQLGANRYGSRHRAEGNRVR